MVSPSIATFVTMMETLPEETQSQIVEHLRGWLLDMELEALEELEDIGLGNAMQEAEQGEFVSEDEIQKILRKED